MPRMLKIEEVIQITGLSRSSILAQVKEGTFPKSSKIGAKRVAWVDSDIQEWIEGLVAKQKTKQQ